jgi:nucleotide-binding universal stress UspA family protein
LDGAHLALRKWMSFERILVATDFSDGSRRALEYALCIAEKFGSELTLVHSWETPNYSYATDLYLPVEMLASIEKAAVARLEQVTTELKSRFPGVKAQLRSGSPWEQVLGAATDMKADLIVMGTHGRRGLERALLGSVAEKVVRMSRIPVLTVHGAKE